MVHSRLLLGLLAAGPVVLVLVQGCALFTCVEDDCDSLSGGSAPGTGGAGTATASTVTGSDVTASSASGGGGSGGEGGNTAVTCTEGIAGTLSAVAINGPEVALLTNIDRIDRVFNFDASTLAETADFNTQSGGGGKLAAFQNGFVYANGGNLQAVTPGLACEPPEGVVQAMAGTATRLVLLRDNQSSPIPLVTEVRDTSCKPEAMPRSVEGATAVQTDGEMLLYDMLIESLDPLRGPCFESVLVPGPVCNGETDVRGIALIPATATAFYRTSIGVFRLEMGQPEEPFHAFTPADEKPAPMAATVTHVFFSTSNEASGPALWRCPVADPNGCTSIPVMEVRGLAASDTTAYFSDGSLLCRWTLE